VQFLLAGMGVSALLSAYVATRRLGFIQSGRSTKISGSERNQTAAFLFIFMVPGVSPDNQVWVQRTSL
jgi:hypothetical protein